MIPTVTFFSVVSPSFSTGSKNSQSFERFENVHYFTDFRQKPQRECKPLQ